MDTSRLASLLLALACLLGWAARGADPRPKASNKPVLVWEQRHNCRLVPNESHDGDSFVVRDGKEELGIRLYFVDAPETDNRDPERLAEQGAAFGISGESARELGRMAREFTAGFLARPCDVETRGEGAGGRGKHARWYGAVTVGSTNLATELVRHGLARIHDTNHITADDPRKKTWLDALRRAEAEAKEAGRGGWDRTRFPADQPGPAPRPPAKINLNTASREQLDSLPGIGPVSAQRLIDARPIRSLEDLKRIKGIGEKTYAGLTNLVTLGP